jgi:hypothetical protein
VSPEFVEAKPEFVEKENGYEAQKSAAATNLLPSADEAMESQNESSGALGALVCVQVWANVESIAAVSPQNIITTGIKIFTGCET